MQTPIKVTHVIQGLGLREGGGARLVSDLVTETSKSSEVSLSLISQSVKNQPCIIEKNTDFRFTNINYKSPLLNKLALKSIFELLKIESGNGSSIVHNHGIWLPINHWASRISEIKKIPIIIQPHGSLSEEARGFNSFKKSLAMTVFQRRDLEKAATLIATSKEEHQTIRRLNLTNPVAVIPNGLYSNKNSLSIDTKQPVNRVREVLFLSRIHPIKGLENLVHAWAKIQTNGWHLTIAGPDELGYAQKIIKIIELLNVQNSVSYIGPVENDEKRNLYLRADLFVLPSFSENFGLVVAEALSFGVPVITTINTPWKELSDYKCGWCIEANVDSLCITLTKAMNMSNDERYSMKKNAIVYAKQFDWDKISSMIIDTYKWVLNQSNKPIWIHLN